VSANVAHHFDDARQQRHAAVIGMWIFLITEVMFFGGLFTGYSVYRVTHFLAFEEGSRHLDRLLGAVNTGVLLTSSLTMALAVHAAAHGRGRMTSVLLGCTILLGSAFLAIKAYEYWHKYETGLVPYWAFHPDTLFDARVDPRELELFFSFYFAMTGVHALHMVIGIAVLSVLAVLAWRGRFCAEYHTPVEVAGLYWHFVDIVWVFLFPLLYLIAG
jgi:cytochrome c oxidase subunit 3